MCFSEDIKDASSHTNIDRSERIMFDLRQMNFSDAEVADLGLEIFIASMVDNSDMNLDSIPQLIPAIKAKIVDGFDAMVESAELAIDNEHPLI